MADVPIRENAGGKRFGCLLYSASFVAVILLVVTLGYLIWFGGARSELDVEIARIREAGEPLWFSELAPKERPANLQDDATPLFLIAIEKLQSPGQTFNSLISATPPTPPGDYPELAQPLQANREALEMLRLATEKPYFRLPLDFDTTTPAMIILEPVQRSREFPRLLRGEVIQSLGTGDPDRALRAVLTTLGLSELFRDEPFLITQLVRIANATTGLEMLTQILAFADLTPEQFDRLDDRLATIERNFSLRSTILSERAMSFTTMEHIAENASLLNNGNGGGGLEYLGSGLLRPNHLADEAFMLRTLSQFAEMIDEPGQKGRDGVAAYDDTVRNASKRFILSRLLLPAIQSTRQAAIRFRQKLQIARLGIRVDRFHASHRRLPSTLDESLDPQLTALPTDLYNNLPLAYKADATGFVIYSLGENGVDDDADKDRDAIEHFTKFEVRYPPGDRNTPQRP